MARKNAVVETTLLAGELTFQAVGCPDTVTINLPGVISTWELMDEFDRTVAVHGVKQKVSDAAALGAGATPAQKFVAMRTVAKAINARSWQARGTVTAAAQARIDELNREVEELRAKMKAAGFTV